MIRLGTLASACAAALAVAALLPPAAGAGWDQPVGGASPVNANAGTDRDAGSTSLTSVGGVPFLAWSEHDGVNSEIRVARLNEAGDDWTEIRSALVVNGAGINQSDTRNANNPKIASVGGVPYVAWIEDDGGNTEVRVARLTQTVFGARWLQPWIGVSDTDGGINESPTRNAQTPALASIGGAPYVAWSEFDGTNVEVRVARLNSAGTAWEQPWTGAGATHGGVNVSASEGGNKPSLADVGGVPFVAWEEAAGSTRQLRVARLDGTTWLEPVGGASPINHDPADFPNNASLAAVGGVPVVAWTEFDGANLELRASRLITFGTDDWVELVGGPSPINESSARDASSPSLTGVGDVPYVAWQESDGTNTEIRVSRLNAGGSAWEQVVGGASPVNEAADRNAFGPSLATIGGFPWIAWDETDGDNREARVARLEPEFGALAAAPSETGATVSAVVRTFGLPFPVGFEFGSGLASETSAEPAPTGPDEVTVGRDLAGLAPSTTHDFRPFATVGVPAPRVLGPTGSFTTLTPVAAGAPLTLTDLRLRPAVFAAARRGAAVGQRRRVGTRVSYALSASARVTFGVQRAVRGRRVGGRCRKATPRNRRGRPCRRLVTVRGRFAHAGAQGPNRLRFSGRLRGRKLRPGTYRLQARALDAAGNRSALARRGFRVVRR